MLHSDNHVHTSFSSDSDTPMEDMLLTAISYRYPSICFTDHMDYDFPDNEEHLNFLFDPDRYFSELNRLSKMYPQIEIRKGIELGLKPDLVERCNTLTSSYPFDFVIGSTHLVDNTDPYDASYWEKYDEKKGIIHYYKTALQNIQSGIDFDVFGHIDYIIRYTPTQKRLRSDGIHDEKYAKQCLAFSFDIIDEILKELIEKGKGIELNTAGLKYGLGHPNPHEFILKRYHELGGDILTIGSDGHEPQHLAYDFDRVPAILHECGYKYYSYFKERKPVMIPIMD